MLSNKQFTKLRNAQQQLARVACAVLDTAERPNGNQLRLLERMYYHASKLHLAAAAAGGSDVEFDLACEHVQQFAEKALAVWPAFEPVTEGVTPAPDPQPTPVRVWALSPEPISLDGLTLPSRPANRGCRTKDLDDSLESECDRRKA